MNIKDKLLRSDLASYLINLKSLSYRKTLLTEYWEHAPEINNLNIMKFREQILAYVDSLKVSKTEYIFSKSCSTPCLYASVYACMIKGLLSDISEDEKREWKVYLDSFQRADGLFYDERCYNEKYDEGEGWGARHLVPHILIAYERLGEKPQYPLEYLERFYSKEYMINWLEEMDWTNSWGASNAVMNVGVALQYARDKLKCDVGEGLEALELWLMNHMTKKYPLWHKGKLNSKNAKYDAIRGAYHIYPILLYDSIEIPYMSNMIKFLLVQQNKWGGFDFRLQSTACDDIDAIDPLIRFAKKERMKDIKIENTLLLAYKNVMSNQNEDGGFVFSRAKNGFIYGGCTNLSSIQNESNLFGTWFRLVSILEILDYFDVTKMNTVNISGYEYLL